MELTQAMLEGDWVVVVNEVDVCDFTTPDELGRIDAMMGLPCNPTEYFAKLGDIELYIWAYKDTLEAMELEEAREDEEWIRRGC